MQEIRVGVATSAYNEGKNLGELYTRVKKELEDQIQLYRHRYKLSYMIAISDNASEDDSREVLQRIVDTDESVTILLNDINYGGEPSSIEAIRQCKGCDIVIYMCSDLQDPPEAIGRFLELLLCSDKIDGVFATKRNTSESSMMRLMRSLYYRLINYSAKASCVPSGYHGFGAYRRVTIQRTLEYWDNTDLTLRKCFTMATDSRKELKYKQASRKEGKTSFGLKGYFTYGLRSLIDGDAATSRIAIALALMGVLVTIVGAGLVTANYLTGESGYSSGTPTILVVVCGGFTINFVILALIARCLEAGFRVKKRTKPVYRLIGSSGRA